MQVTKAVYYTKLLDIYGGMLTQKQHSILTDYLCFDNTLSEIAESHSTTRQAVKDIIDRTCEKLDEFEQRLHFCEKAQTILDMLKHLSGAVPDDTKDKVNDIIKSMEA